MQISNLVSARGFIVGWEIANLGNALSCLANTFVLGKRIGVPSAYPFMKTYAEVFERGHAIALCNVRASTNVQALDELLDRLKPVLSAHPAQADPGAGSSFEDLGRADVANVVWQSRYEGVVLRDWCADGSEDNVRRFCRGNLLRRGNGLIIAGSYWRQYTDMRRLGAHGVDLRRHLGALRADGLSGRAVHMSAMDDAIKIGVHVRQGDYSLWHGGRYYFSIEEYKAVIERMRRELGSRKHRFYLFSDRQLGDAFRDCPDVYGEQGQFADDFIAMSRCDVAVGPPSTFATWSAFLGKTKRVVLTRETLADTGRSLLDRAVDIGFPTGSYLPGDETSGPI